MTTRNEKTADKTKSRPEEGPWAVPYLDFYTYTPASAKGDGHRHADKDVNGRVPGK